MAPIAALGGLTLSSDLPLRSQVAAARPSVVSSHSHTEGQEEGQLSCIYLPVFNQRGQLSPEASSPIDVCPCLMDSVP